MRAAIEEQLNLIAHGRADFNAVVRHAADTFLRKFRYFVENILAMDELFEVSFSSLAASGKPLSRYVVTHKIYVLLTCFFPDGFVLSFSSFTLKPIFHWKLGSHLLPIANEIITKNMKCTWPTAEFCIGAQPNPTYIPLAFIWVSRRVKRKF